MSLITCSLIQSSSYLYSVVASPYLKGSFSFNFREILICTRFRPLSMQPNLASGYGKSLPIGSNLATEKINFMRSGQKFRFGFMFAKFLLGWTKFPGEQIQAKRQADTDHYRKPCVCRVPRDLPWAKPRAPGKRSVCRVQTKAAHGKGKAHGKRIFCRVSLSKTHDKLQAHGILASLT